MEHGRLEILYRPRVEEQDPAELADVQRLLLLLDPQAGPMQRLIAIGRKRIRTPRRFWGFVDLVLDPFDMNAALGAQVYGTKTRGLRHLPAARSAARGTYELVTHGPHTHFRWVLSEVMPDHVVDDLLLEPSADYIISVMNPDPAAWGLVEPPDLQFELFDDLEVHVTIPTPFPAPLQAKFDGRRYAQVDSPEWLNHPGAEVVFIRTD
jgi:hypothetical protein